MASLTVSNFAICFCSGLGQGPTPLGGPTVSTQLQEAHRNVQSTAKIDLTKSDGHEAPPIPIVENYAAEEHKEWQWNSTGFSSKLDTLQDRVIDVTDREQ